MRPDSHSGGTYIVNNLYLDDRYDNLYRAKYMGQFQRDKYRLRYYNNDMSFIRLERKHKDGIMSYKETIPVSQEQYMRIKAGDLEFIHEEIDPLWQKLSVLQKIRGLRPTAVYSYQREAYVYELGDVRFTFDSPPFCPEQDAVFGYDPLSCSYGKEDYSLLLEVKYTAFMPEIIKQLLNGLRLAYTGISKYCVARERGYLPYGKI